MPCPLYNRRVSYCMWHFKTNETYSPQSLGSTLAGTHTSHWWQQERHPTQTAPIHQYKSYVRR